ncbi:DUF4013 domain-containing protein [Halorubellus sp. JP-L1]|uniref:DUF4013 domain-containing protein n=1 Tax=Halorubellus sp. JP-L1 TaxID=2715753 RepID=UPI00140D9EE8|nr:DUF4013 domain-containing protein [Halorubellus sp. JP-L1]NHN40799.1 DUF4013 domain-containing protein [Halorubellus sp. JP-L1]
MRPNRFGVFEYPIAGKDREWPVVVGWILVMVSFVIPVAPLVPYLGYLVRVLAASSREDATPPIRTDPVGLLTQGILGSVIVATYLLPPVLALLVTVYGASERAGAVDVGFSDSLVLYAGSTVVLAVFLLAVFLVPIALARYADDGFRAAFGARGIAPVASHAAYFARWMAGTVALVLTAAFANVAVQVDRAGPVIASLVVAYGVVLAAHLWGVGVRLARER